MSTILYWFSGTGNSLVAARELASRLGDDVQLLPLARAMSEGVRPAQRIGVVFPVYAFGPPIIVTEFFRLVPATESTYLFAVATHSGMPGRPMHFIRRILSRRKLSLAAGWSLALPGNCITLHSAYSPASQAKLFAKAPAKIDQIAQGIAQQRRGVYEDSHPPLSWLVGGVWSLGAPHLHEADKKFYADHLCTRCGLCERICPVRNIRLEGGMPTWQGRCEQCMACIQWCPVQSIQYGQGTQTRKRYHHPQVTAEDICAQQRLP